MAALAQSSPIAVSGQTVATLTDPPARQEVERGSTTSNASMGTPSAEQARQDVQVQLQYLAKDDVYNRIKPVQVVPGFLDREGKTNVRLVPGPLETLHDVRDRFDKFSLDGNGFAYVRAPTSFTEWTSQPQIGERYLKEMEDLLRHQVDGCDEIIFYDARIRQSNDEGLRIEGLSFNPFARQVHVDNTEKSVIEKIRNLTEMKADYLLRGRARIINLWRAIKHPIYDCGLAVADGSKLSDGDVKECDRIRRDTGKYWDTMGVIQHRPGFDWYYMSQQDEDTVLMFKNYDSDTSVPARHCLHTAFDMPPGTIPRGSPTRESIEVRALVFTHRKEELLSAARLLMSKTPHPLAASLKKSNLKRIDDDCSVIDRVCKDIDEANEAKDAELLLRKRKIRSLEKERDALKSDRDDLTELVERLKTEHEEVTMQLKLAQRQLDIRNSHVTAHQDQAMQLLTEFSKQKIGAYGEWSVVTNRV